MGYIKEPPGIDFIIGPHPYTEADRAATSAFIKAHKAKEAKKAARKKAMAAKKEVAKRAA